MAAGARLALVLVALVTAACRPSPAARAEETRRTLRSWAATLELLEQERARGAVPEDFAHQVRRAAEEARRKAAAP